MNSNIFAAQAGRPSGLLGRVMGRIMGWHNQPDNEWTISLLKIQPTDHVLEIGFGPGRAIQLAAGLPRMGSYAESTTPRQWSVRPSDAMPPP